MQPYLSLLLTQQPRYKKLNDPIPTSTIPSPKPLASHVANPLFPNRRMSGESCYCEIGGYLAQGTHEC